MKCINLIDNIRKANQYKQNKTEIDKMIFVIPSRYIYCYLLKK
jgi:hypothetical protein